eukprot:CAMPEP_0181103682 /NCGR_PEP_ID=MMETSP1071-20121207/15002_1 /TAXON_ID=35127 /ORGANISM="Thalassiosira sp., Strain NH16" /LENGTH=221 /DNA_ID=CAMNT_0023186785 /DNA_START=116 /DNA_END=778 /DNA_ORIENTATION=-
MALLQFKFEDFEGLSVQMQNGQHIHSEETTDPDGNAWKLQLFPCGYRSEEEGWVSIYLKYAEKNNVLATFSFIMRNACGGVHTEVNYEGPVYLFKEGGGAHGNSKLIKRSEILDGKNDILCDGALCFDVLLQFEEQSSLYKPSGSVLTKMLQLLKNTDNADASFKVGDEIVTSHKLILSTNAPVLFEFCGENNDGSPVAINDITAEIFRIILRYVYGEEIP